MPRLALLVMAGMIGLAAPLASAAAQSGAGHGDMTALFKAIDTDNDGTISLAEQQHYAARLFDRLDTNHDGTLTIEEFRPWAAANPTMRNHLTESFRAIDTDGDGTISKKEFLAASKKRFEQADKDHEGTLTLDEFSAAQGLGDMAR